MASSNTTTPSMPEYPLELILQEMNVDLTIGITIVCESSSSISAFELFTHSNPGLCKVGLLIAMYVNPLLLSSSRSHHALRKLLTIIDQRHQSGCTVSQAYKRISISTAARVTGCISKLPYVLYLPSNSLSDHNHSQLVQYP